MKTTFMKELGSRICLAAAATLLAACVDGAPLAPSATPEATAATPETTAATPEATAATPEATAATPVAVVQPAALPAQARDATTLATLRRVTARYHNLDAALADGFVFLHPCEERPGEGPVGIVYAHPERIADGVIDPELPDALVYAPTSKGRERLAAVELVVPFDVSEDPPTFLGATFQGEDEFGVWGLHVWLWIENPRGLFAPANPRISC